MDKLLTYFSHGRTALKYGIMQLNIQAGDSILVPDYICDAVIEPLNQLKIKPNYYKVNNDLNIDFIELSKKITKSVKALMIVHYFGNPQDINLSKQFCNKNNLYLIEDNAHGHSGSFEGQLLGTFGDIGFSSPRKLFSINFGGVLYSKMKIKNLPELKTPSSLSLIKKKLKRNLPNILLKTYKNKQINTTNTNLSDMLIDNESLNKLKTVDYSNEKIKRKKLYNLWYDFALKSNLKPLFPKFYSEAIPWAFPAYVINREEQVRWLLWGEKNNINIFTWPRLPSQIINIKGQAFQRSNKIVVFPIDNFIDADQIMNLKK